MSPINKFYKSTNYYYQHNPAGWPCRKLQPEAIAGFWIIYPPRDGCLTSWYITKTNS